MPWFEYVPQRGRQPQPIVQVQLWHGDQSIHVEALVDSGAQYSLLDMAIAEALGLERRSAGVRESIGATGTSFPSFHWPDARLEFEFLGERIPFRGAFAPFQTADDQLNLLGRADFFQRFIIQFWDAAELMNIDVSPDFPRAAHLP